MNIKIAFVFTTVAVFFGTAAAQDSPSRPPFTPPECTEGVDLDSCSLPDGQDGMFMCRAQEEFSSLRPPRGPPPSEDAMMMAEGEGPDGDGMRFDRRPRGRGPRPNLSRSMCVPLEPPDENEGGDIPPFGLAEEEGAAPEQEQGDMMRPPRGQRPPRLECGCCDGVCPTMLECGCTCDIVSRNGTLIEADGGVWVDITKNETFTFTKCVRPSYADANVACVADCDSAVAGSEVGEDLP